MATKTKKRTEPKAHQVPKDFRIVDLSAAGPLEFLAAEPPAEGEAPKLRNFRMQAYNGGPMKLSGFHWPVVVDLAGLNIGAKSRPILRDHDSTKIVGHSTGIQIMEGQRIVVEGTASGAGEHAREVEATADNGFPWQASIGASADKIIFLDRGEKQTVNGKQITGPLYIARKANLKEVSFVALGADDSTSSQMTASANGEDKTAKAVQAELKKLRASGMTITAIAKQVSRFPATLTAIETGEAEMPVPRSLLDKLKRINDQ